MSLEIIEKIRENESLDLALENPQEMAARPYIFDP